MEENTKESVTEERESNFESLAKKSKKEINGYEEGLYHGKRIFFPLLLILAAISDLIDAIPIIGFLVKLIVLLVIWYNFDILGKAPSYLEQRHRVEINTKTRLILRALGFTDIIPLMNLLPLTTLSVLIVWFQTRKRMQAKEGEASEEKSALRLISSQNKS